ncbi:MAG: hypothetical protein IJW70_09120 [Clostridia bacterium]|nr:hypothetical protein [Clostridia bacterium]
MFDNIGKKIKILAEVLCWVGIVLSVLFGAILIISPAYTGEMDLLYRGIFVIVFGCLFSWVGSFCLFGFGELIEKNSETTQYVKEIRDHQKKQYRNTTESEESESHHWNTLDVDDSQNK